MEQWVDDLKLVLDEIGIEKAHIFGTSNGSFIVVRFAAKYPERTGAIVHYGMYKIIMEGVQLFSSNPGVDYFYLDPSGNVYPSVVHNYVMGNLAEDDFEKIWTSPKSDDIRRTCREDATPYWMGCMLRKALLDHRFQIGVWALKNKFLKLKL